MTSVDQAVPAPEVTERSAHANARGSFQRFAAPAIVFVAAAAAFGYSAFMDPDPHHDGIQMAPAVAVSEGLFIHRDVFDQYGPITAWLQGAAVFVFGPHLLTIRLLTALLLSICAVLMFLVARSVMRSTLIAMLLSVLWIALWPGRSVESLTYLFLPWPSITFLLLQLLAALFVIRILRQPPATDAWFAALGVVTGIAVLTRLNYGAPMAVCIVIALFLFQSNVRTISGRQWASLAIGLAAPIAAVAGLLVLNGALGAFVGQTIAGPLTGAATAGTSTPWFFVKNAYLWGSLPLFAVLAVTYWWAWRRPNSRKVPLFLAIAGSMALTVWVSASIAGGSVRDLIMSRLSWAPAIDHEAFQPLFLVAILTPVVGIALLIVMVHTLLASRRQPDAAGEAVQVQSWVSVFRAAPERFRVTAVLIALAGSSLVQLVPFADPNHVWWAAPLMLIVIALILTDGLSQRWRWSLLAVLCLPPLVIAVPRAIDYASIPRTQIQSGVLAGMLAPVDRIDDVLQIDEILGPVPPQSASFSCADGIFAVWNGRYLADSAAFVQWAFGTDGTTAAEATGINSGAPRREFVCLMPNADGSIPDYTPPPGSEVVRVVGPISISYFNYMYFVELAKAPTSS